MSADSTYIHPQAAAGSIDDSLAMQMHPMEGDAWPAMGDTALPDSTARILHVGNDSVSAARLDSIIASVPIDPVGSLDGLRPEALHTLPGQQSVIPAILVALFVGAGCNPTAFRRTLAHYRSELWSVRPRRNAFDDDSTGGMAVMRIFLTSAAVIVCGVCASLCFGALSTFSILAGVALAAAFFMFEYCSYWLTGYAFTFTASRNRWLQGFTASVVYTGLCLFVPALLLLFFPEWAAVLAPLSLGVFLLFRCIFITKGIRIFFEGFPSLLYFILYLCTLEVIPLLALLKIYPLLMGADL